jgi:hypothetical protein
MRVALIDHNEVRNTERKKQEACNIIAWVHAMPHYRDLQSFSETEEVVGNIAGKWWN